MTRKKKNPNRPASKFIVSLDSVEMAAGHDGLFRGEPEPVFVTAAFGVSAAHIASLARVMTPVPLKGTTSFPCRLELKDLSILEGSLPNGTERLLFLMAALEDDDGGEIQGLYSTLGESSLLQVWLKEEDIPTPKSLREASVWPALESLQARPIHLLCRGNDLYETCKKDELVGVCAFTLPVVRNFDSGARLAFVSKDAKNDWTAFLRVRIR